MEIMSEMTEMLLVEMAALLPEALKEDSVEIEKDVIRYVEMDLMAMEVKLEMMEM